MSLIKICEEKKNILQNTPKYVKLFRITNLIDDLLDILELSMIINASLH